MKVVTLVGARPQFIKAAALSRVLRKKHQEVLVHTGQHYDSQMSDIFFEELQIPRPEFHLNVGPAAQGAQTGVMLSKIEECLIKQNPDWVLIYGDTNSTLAGALAASKLHIPIAHVEAGLRSYNRRMPEEINRVVADNLSRLCFCPSQTAVDNLAKEGIVRGVHIVGDIMADVMKWGKSQIQGHPREILTKLKLLPKKFILATIHRAENTDQVDRLKNILEALERSEEKVVIPVHPRTQKVLAHIGYVFSKNILAVEPLGYLDMLALESAAKLIVTDSGGIQKEAYWAGTPCITVRDETEWVETVEGGWNKLVGTETAKILKAIREFSIPKSRPELYGNGQTAQHCIDILEKTRV